MSEQEENVPLQDRYDSLKVLCSGQVLANELLKDELDRLRKSFKEISRHRSFLMDKVIALQSKQADREPKRPASKTSSQGNHTPNQRRPTAPQRVQGIPESRQTGPQRPKVHPNERIPIEESDTDSIHGEFDNGWDDDFSNMPVPSYRRSQGTNLKRRPRLVSTVANRSHPGPSAASRSGFKRPKISMEPFGPSSRNHEFSPLLKSYEVTDNSSAIDDFSEEPPLIYSKSVGYQGDAIRRNSASASIVKTSPVVSGSTRMYLQKPPGPGGNYGAPRMH